MSSGPWQAVITLQCRPAVVWWMLGADDVMGGRLLFPADAVLHGVRPVACRGWGEFAVCQASHQRSSIQCPPMSHAQAFLPRFSTTVGQSSKMESAEDNPLVHNEVDVHTCDGTGGSRKAFSIAAARTLLP